MHHFQTSWRSTDGLKLFAQGWEPVDIPQKAVVCLVHGLGEHTSRYTHVAQAFCNQGFALFGFDLRGHGQSDGKHGHFESIELVLQDIDILLEQARECYNGFPIILFGHSLGGVLVLYYTLTRKPSIKAVIATNPGLITAIEKQPLKVLTAKILGSLIPKATLSSGLMVTAISRDPEVVKAYKHDPLVHNKVSLGFGKIMLAVTKWTLAHANQFPLPLLLMYGSKDAIAFPEGSKKFAGQIPKGCQLVEWEGAYHELHNEPEKKMVFEKIVRWMKELLARGN